MKKGLITAFEVILIAAVVFCNGLLIQTPLPDGWSMTLLDKYCQTISDVAFLDRYIQRNPTDFQAFRARAQSYSVDSYWPHVVADCTKALELNKDDLISRRLRAFSYYQLEQDDAALSDYNTVIDSGEGIAQDYAYRSLIYYRKKKFDNAIADADAAVRKDTMCAPAYYARGLSELHQGKDKDALYDAKLACQLDYELSGPYVLMGMVFNDRKKYNRAIIMCEQGLLHDPTNGALHCQVAVSQDKLKKFDKAIHSCNVALSVAENKTVRCAAFSTRALAQLHKHKNKEAIDDSTKALSLDPECLLAYKVRARAYEQLNKTAEAAQDQKAAQQISKKWNIPEPEIDSNDLVKETETKESKETDELSARDSNASTEPVNAKDTESNVTSSNKSK